MQIYYLLKYILNVYLYKMSLTNNNNKNMIYIDNSNATYLLNICYTYLLLNLIWS